MQNQELHRIALTAIIYKHTEEGIKYLITKRAENKKAFPGKWTVPGGGLETDDYTKTEPTTKAGQWYYAVEKALRREVREEVDIEVGRLEYLLDLAFIRPDDVPVIVLSYYGPYESGDVKVDGKGTVDHVWVTYEEVKGYDLIDGILEEIGMVDERLKERG